MRFPVLAALAWLALAAPSFADTISGHVVGVHDGDTIYVLVDRETVKLRLAWIDAPELSQPYGQKAKQGLSDLVFGKDVTADVVSRYKYGGPVGEVSVDGQNVSLAMVETGRAWAYRTFLTAECVRQGNACPILAAEHDARVHRRGLWRLQADQRIPPWKWRAAKQ